MAITKISPSVVDFDAGITITTDDNSNNLTITSTDADASNGPNIKFHRNSGSPADNDYGGYILFNAENDASEDTAFSYIGQQLIDVSNGTEDGRLFIYNMQAGTSVNAIDVLPTETVFNEGSVDRDFRVESDAQSLAFFVDGGENAVGLQTNTEADGTAMTSPLTVSGANHGGNIFESYRTGNSIHRQYMSTTGKSYIDIYGSSAPNLQVRIAGSDVAKVTAAGICFGSDTAAANSLDDYEEGTWTPYFQGTSSNGSTSYATQQGYYTKVGRLVTAQFYVGGTWSGNYGGQVLLNGFPYSVASGHGGNWQAVGTYNIDNNAEAAYLSGNGGTSYFLLYVTGSGTSWGNVNWGSATGSSGATIYLAGHVMYHV